jgi:hypothetical protein
MNVQQAHRFDKRSQKLNVSGLDLWPPTLCFYNLFPVTCAGAHPHMLSTQKLTHTHALPHKLPITHRQTHTHTHTHAHMLNTRMYNLDMCPNLHHRPLAGSCGLAALWVSWRSAAP